MSGFLEFWGILQFPNHSMIGELAKRLNLAIPVPWQVSGKTSIYEIMPQTCHPAGRINLHQLFHIVTAWRSPLPIFAGFLGFRSTLLSL